MSSWGIGMVLLVVVVCKEGREFVYVYRGVCIYIRVYVSIRDYVCIFCFVCAWNVCVVYIWDVVDVDLILVVVGILWVF